MEEPVPVLTEESNTAPDQGKKHKKHHKKDRVHEGESQTSPNGVVKSDHEKRRSRRRSGSERNSHNNESEANGEKTKKKDKPSETLVEPDPEEKDSAQKGSVAVSPKLARKSTTINDEESPSASPKSNLRNGSSSNLASPNEHRKIKKIQIDENLEIHQVGSSNSLRASDSDDAKREKKKKKKKEKSEDESDSKRPRSRSSRALNFKTNEIGEIIYKGHPSWALMQNIQTGIRHSVGKSGQLYREQDLQRIAQLQEFEKYEQLYKSPKVLVFPPEGGPETQAHKTPSFKFKDYCPLVFRHLREKFQIDPADYMVSLCNTLENDQNALRLLPTPGKSGSLFFFSHDMKYILKTIPKREAKLLRFLLPAYYKHVMENGNTLLPRFFGLHRVKPHGGRQVRFVVMGNVFATQKKIHERYDIKGSKFGREASQEEREIFRENVTYKDNDWLNFNKKLYLGPERKKAFIEQLQRDCTLLEKLNIMDYSLLIGIHDCSREECDCHLRRLDSNASLRRKRRKDSAKKIEKKEEEKKEEEKKDEIKIEKLKDENTSSHSQSEFKKSDTEEDKKSESSGLTSFIPGHRKNVSSVSAISDRKPSMVQTNLPLPDKFQTKSVSTFQADEGGMRAIKDGHHIEESYYVGIIDILMLYSLRKRGEHAYKSLRFGKDISAVHPVEYSHRFQQFVSGIVE